MSLPGCVLSGLRKLFTDRQLHRSGSAAGLLARGGTQEGSFWFSKIKSSRQPTCPYCGHPPSSNIRFPQSLLGSPSAPGREALKWQFAALCCPSGELPDALAMLLALKFQGAWEPGTHPTILKVVPQERGSTRTGYIIQGVGPAKKKSS